jgi:GNAT superfamily N-acetyltransferase
MGGTKTTADRMMVRPMKPADATAVIEMARELAASIGDAAPAVPESDLIRLGSGPERWFDCLVAEIPNQIVGYSVVCKAFEAHTGKKRLWLGDLYVRPRARRNGAGRALIMAITRHALELGCDAVYWELWRMNVEGGTFYRKLMAEEAADVAVMRLDKHRLAAIVAGE